MLSLLGRAALALAVAGCTAHETDEAVAPPVYQTPRDFGIELPLGAGGDDDEENRGAGVWLAVDSLTVVGPDNAIWKLGAPTIDANGMPVGLFELLDALPRAGTLQLSVDRRVSSERLVRVLHTAARTGWPVSLRCHPYHHREVEGWPEELFRGRGGAFAGNTVLKIEPAPFASSHPPAHPPFGALAADLLLEWDEHGVFATAQMRPADRPPFAIDWYEDGTVQLPQRVPLRLTDGPGAQEALDHDAVVRLASALCEVNGGPTGLALRPLPTTLYADLLAVAVMARFTEKCQGPRRLELRMQPARAAASAVTVAGLVDHVRAQVQGR